MTHSTIDAVLERMRAYTQSSIRIESAQGTVIHIDPFKMEEAPRDADIILVTHEHFDHYSPDDIARVAGSASTILVPAAMADKVRALGFGEVIGVTPRDALDIADIHIDVVAAYNINKGFHPRSSKWVGYVATVDGARIYHMGDTDDTPEARAITCDILCIPIGGTYTMNPAEAAAYVNTCKPAVAVPMHYGTIVGSPSDAQTFAAAVADQTRVAPILER